MYEITQKNFLPTPKSPQIWRKPSHLQEEIRDRKSASMFPRIKDAKTHVRHTPYILFLVDGKCLAHTIAMCRMYALPFLLHSRWKYTSPAWESRGRRRSCPYIYIVDEKYVPEKLARRKSQKSLIIIHSIDTEMETYIFSYRIVETLDVHVRYRILGEKENWRGEDERFRVYYGWKTAYVPGHA